MNTVIRAITTTIAAFVVLLMIAPAADSGTVEPLITLTPATNPGNFNPDAGLDTSDIVEGKPNHYAGGGWVCFRSEEYPEWGCVRSKDANPKIFTDPRVIDIRIIPPKSLYTK